MYVLFSELVYTNASVDYSPTAVPFGNFIVVSQISALIKMYNKTEILPTVKKLSGKYSVGK